MKPHKRYATGLIIKLYIILGKIIKYNAKWNKYFSFVLQSLIYIVDIVNYRQIIAETCMHMQSRYVEPAIKKFFGISLRDWRGSMWE